MRLLACYSLIVFLLAGAVAVDERAALISFKISCTNSNSLWNWGSTVSFCSWTGVECDSSSRVVGLSLGGMNLQCSTLSLLGSLQSLTFLNISDNEFSFRLDTDIVPRTLEVLDISKNPIIGTVSLLFSSSLPNLRWFNASRTQVDQIPFFEPFPSSLEVCDLSGLLLNCPVPEWVASKCGGSCIDSLSPTIDLDGKSPSYGSGDNSVDSNYGPIYSGNIAGTADDIDNDNNNNDDNNNNNDNNNNLAVSIVGDNNVIDVLDEVVNLNLNLNVNPNINRNRNNWNTPPDHEEMQPAKSDWTPEGVTTLVKAVLESMQFRGINGHRTIRVNGKSVQGASPENKKEKRQQGPPPQQQATYGSGDNNVRSNFAPIFEENAANRQADDNDNNNNGDNNNNNDNNNNEAVNVQGFFNQLNYHTKVLNYNLDLNLNSNDNQNVNNGFAVDDAAPQEE